MAPRCPHQVLVLGPPGAGKGTQAGRLAERLGLVHISPGKILRERAGEDSDFGRRLRAIMAAGELVPDELIDRVVGERLRRLDPEQGFVLDGYPRTAAEARHLMGLLAELGRLRCRPAVVWLEVPRDALVRRLRHRRALEGREDDAEGAIARRLAIHDAHARAVRESLEGWTDPILIVGDREPDAVTDEILHRLCPPQAEPVGRGAFGAPAHEG